MTYREIIFQQISEDGYWGMHGLFDCVCDEDLLNHYGPREEAEDWQELKEVYDE